MGVSNSASNWLIQTSYLIRHPFVVCKWIIIAFVHIRTGGIKKAATPSFRSQTWKVDTRLWTKFRAENLNLSYDRECSTHLLNTLSKVVIWNESLLFLYYLSTDFFSIIWGLLSLSAAYTLVIYMIYMHYFYLLFFIIMVLQDAYAASSLII